MPTIVTEFSWPDRIVVGTIGRPGERTFYLQVRDGARVASVALEKEQSALLAEKIDEILDELMTADGNPFSIPRDTPIELVDNEPLDQPVEEQFRTGTMSLGWDPSTVQVVIEAFPIVDVEPAAGDEFGGDGSSAEGSGSEGVGSGGLGAGGLGAGGFGADAFGADAFGADGFGADGFGAGGFSAEAWGADGFGSGSPQDAALVEPAEMLVVRIPVGTARAFAKRTREIVGAGRPLCPLCGAPMDASGHSCALPDGL